MLKFLDYKTAYPRGRLRHRFRIAGKRKKIGVGEKKIGERSEPTRGVLPYKRIIGMCRWMGSHFHDWSNYNGVVAFSIVLLEWGSKFSDFWGK